MCEGKKKKLVGFYSNIVNAQSTPRRLTNDDMPCDFIALSVNNTENVPADTFVALDANNTYDQALVEVFWGFDNTPVHQVFPLTPWPYLIPVANAKDIFVRCDGKKAGGVSQVSWSLFKYVDD